MSFDNLRQDLANTIPMVALGTLISILIGMITGILSAWRRGTRLDKVSTNVAIAFYSFPTQWLALVLVIYLAEYLPSHGMSNAWAAYASACPWFPADSVMTPRRRCSASSCRTALMAPRTLNDPVRWRFSALSQAPGPATASAEAIGVGNT